MNHVYIITGYGVPKDITKDGNYQYYLRGAFNAIYDDAVVRKIARPVIVFSGGRTDMFKPYRRTEAAEMLKAFEPFMAKPILRSIVRRWKLVTEPRSISTLENLLHAAGVLRSIGIRRGYMTIFCEHTRAERIRRLARKVLAKSFKVNVRAIDFDTSGNRYLDPKFLLKKEEMDWKFALWALRSSANMQKHHQLFRDKLAYLRQAGPANHVEAVRRWWEKELKRVITS